MSVDVNVIIKIRKLFDLANDAGASPGEAENAMTMAAALMARHNISEIEINSDLHDQDAAVVGKTTVGLSDEQGLGMWARHLIVAAATLNVCDGISVVKEIERKRKKSLKIVGASFIGRETNREAAALALQYLFNQVAREYKNSLPQGLSQKDRSGFRRTFKNACALRLRTRASNIIYDMKHNNESAKGATGSSALVVSSSIDQQLQSIKEWIEETGQEFKTTVSHGHKEGLGTEAGYLAGDRIPLQNQLGDGDDDE